MLLEKSTIVRFMSWAIAALNRWSPTLAMRWSSRLFLTPPRRRVTRQELGALAHAHQFVFRSSGVALNGFSIGEGPTVFLVHGWGGYAAQFAPLAKQLAHSGYRAVALDFPAHGRSPGAHTNVFRFREAILDWARVHGTPELVVAHSFGAFAVGLALEPLPGDAPAITFAPRGVAFVAPMTSFRFAMDTFASELGLSAALQQKTTTELARRFQFAPEDLELAQRVREQKTPLLVVHDEQDQVVPSHLSARLAEAWPKAELWRTVGLGHGRILADDQVASRLVDFAATRLLAI